MKTETLSNGVKQNWKGISDDICPEISLEYKLFRPHK